MSIFGTKKQKRNDNLVNHIRNLNNVQTERYNNLHEILKEMVIKYHLMHDNIENLQIKNYLVTITAESKGALQQNEILSFGNGCKVNGAGYVMMRRGRISGISLSSKRENGDITVGVSVNEELLFGCQITLQTIPRKYVNFQKPFEVEASSVINFVCLKGNPTTECTVASLLIELDKEKLVPLTL